MKKIIVGTLILFISSFVVIDANAQLKRKALKKNNKRMSNFHGKKNDFGKSKKYNYIGFTINSFNYFGDISPLPQKVSTDIGFTRPAIGFTFGHRLGPLYTLRGEFRYGTLRGSDFDSADPAIAESAGRYVRNLHFRNRIKELTVTAVFDLFKNASTYINRVPLTPYAFIGVTMYHHNPQAYVGADSGLPEADSWVDLRPLGTEGQNMDLPAGSVNEGIKAYKNLQIAIPFGIGARYKLNEVMDLSFEMAVRYTFTDYLDDVSAGYVDTSSFTDPLAAYLSDRSAEVNDAESGTIRFDAGSDNLATTMFNRRLSDGTVAGYGRDDVLNQRGNSNDNDLYFVTTIRASYILGGSFKKAKFR
jgi:hypothetical protein